MRIRELIIALVALACFFALGVRVARHGEPPALLTWEHSLLNHSTLLAWWLAWTCYGDVLVPLAVVLVIVAWLVPAWRARIMLSIVLLLLSWRGADLLQHLFGRPRPLHWVVKHETAFSYPSSHAAIATGFYAFWAAVLYLSQLGPRLRVSAALVLLALAVGICWSRLALGAHYVTDLIGGVLLAVAIIELVLALVPVPLAASSSVAGRLRNAEE